MNHSPIGLFIFSIIFYSHFNSIFDEIEHTPIGVLNRAYLLRRADKCVMKVLETVNPDKAFEILPFVIEKCALSEYFRLEKYGSLRNESAQIFSFFPGFQHPDLKKCHSFLFFGTGSYEMSGELELLTNADFEILDCKYLIIDKRKNIHGLRNYMQVPELAESHLTDILWQYRDEKDFVIEHLYIAEMRAKDISNFLEEKILKIREIYTVIPCQITVRIPKIVRRERIFEFVKRILEDEKYMVMNFRRMDKFTEVYMFAVGEHDCLMRYS